MGDMPVPVRTALFYFEITIEDPGAPEGIVCLGFGGTESYRRHQMLGRYKNSCAYHCDDGKLFQGNTQGTDFGPTVVAGDTVGAGIHHGNNEIFYVRNGVLIGVVNNTLTGVVKPVVALGSPNGRVRVEFMHLNSYAEARPSRLGSDDPKSNLLHLTHDGLTAR